MIKTILILISLLSINSIAAIDKNLPIGLAEQEKHLLKDFIHQARRDTTDAPPGNIHSLGEWEEAEAAMTLWNNNSLIRGLAENGNVKIIADSNSDKSSWEGIVKNAGADPSKFSYFVVPTNSIWVRDYGPWWIVDGNGKFGIVDTIYNRPRPQDDLVPDFIGKQLGVPVYKPALVHTGGNYYSDGLGAAFSSRLVFKENSNFSAQEVLNRMLSFLGIENYVTSPLGEDVTIEHMDTFGKLVAPDTWVFSEFPKSDSQFYEDSERMVALLKTKLSPYGTPYKIFRLKMIGGSGDYRAYINSFISNGALYFPTYGDNNDEVARLVYQEALPGYKIVGVEAKGTEWGDSVHCRTRNLMKKDTIFIFPKVSVPTVTAEVIASPNSEITNVEAVILNQGQEVERIPMTSLDGKLFTAVQNSRLEHGEFYIVAKDSSGKSKTHPLMAPKMTVSF